MEIWKPIAGSNFYEVSNLGRVRSNNYLGHGKTQTLSLNYDQKGYLRVRLYFGKHRKTCKVHRLVAQAFIPNPLNLPEVNHLDGNKANNRAENLEWVTAHENSLHAYANGLKENTRKHAQLLGKTIGKEALERAKLKHFVPVKAVKIDTGEEFVFDSIKEAVATLGVMQSGISAVLTGRQKTCGGFLFFRR